MNQYVCLHMFKYLYASIFIEADVNLVTRNVRRFHMAANATMLNF